MFIKNGKISFASRLVQTNVNIKDTTGGTNSRLVSDRPNYFRAANSATDYGVYLCVHSSELTISDSDYLIPTEISGVSRNTATTNITPNGAMNWTYAGTNNNANPITIKAISLVMRLQDWDESYLIYEENVPERIVGAGETFTFTISTTAN